MKLAPLFHNYELLVDKAEAAFQKMEKEHGQCIRCELHCSDCCNAVFGLFLIEAAYIREQFDHIGEEQKRQVFLRAESAERVERCAAGGRRLDQGGQCGHRRAA